MYAHGARTTGHIRHPPRDAPCPCPRRRVAPRGPPPLLPHRPDLGFGEGVEGSWSEARRSPQRRPVSAAPRDPAYAWDGDPAPWRRPPAGPRCVAWVGRGPLPPSQFRGQARGARRTTVAYISRGNEEVEQEGEREGHWGSAGGQRLPATNGYGGPDHQYCSSVRGGPQDSCNGSHRAFFSTEVPQTQLLHCHGGRRRSPLGPTSDASLGETSVAAARNPRRPTAPDPERHSVRDQIRLVVTHLEGVLGGLKQVHTEMKEVVEQIDRLTANIDLGEGGTAITNVGSAASDVACRPGSRLEGTSEPGLSRRLDEDHVMLRTNSPSPVHMASVVKTNRIAAQPRDPGTRERPAVNGYPSHLYPPRASNHGGRSSQEPAPCLDPVVIIEHCTPGSRTHKPPPYPQNGRCGNGPCPPTNALKTPAHPGRCRQSTSMV